MRCAVLSISPIRQLIFESVKHSKAIEFISESCNQVVHLIEWNSYKQIDSSFSEILLLPLTAKH